MVGKPTAALGLRGQKGGAVVVGVTLEHREPKILLSRFLQTHAAGDSYSFAPYEAAVRAAKESSDEPMAVAERIIAEGCERQKQLAGLGLKQIRDELAAAGHSTLTAALLVNRAGWITDLLEYSLGWSEHVPVAEALAVRDAFRSAARDLPFAMSEVDEKSLMELGAQSLGMGVKALEGKLKALGAAVGPPWRKEQKLACLAAWVSLARTH
jgi:hypothetical protein